MSDHIRDLLIRSPTRSLSGRVREYVALLDSYTIQISMTENSDPRENRTGEPAIAERVNGIIRNEYLADQNVISLAQAQATLQQAVYLYNYKRPHLNGPPCGCDMLVPDEAHKGEGKLKRRWKNYYHKKIIADILDNVTLD